MKPTIFLALTALFVTALPVSANNTDMPPINKRKVEIVFAIDTTGSMSGLIEGAKQKVWFIANEALKAKQKPEVRIGLVAFRDKGDEYVVKSLPLTDDLDKVYEELMAYRADGGGDGPEHVNAALSHAVNEMPWSTDKDTLRLVFLVGDAPPHMDYQDDVKHTVTSKVALKKNIYIHTIQCGGDPSTMTVWKDIARNSEGRFAAIAQDGGVVAVATPFDDELRTLGTELERTSVVYGSAEKRSRKKAEKAHAMGIAASAPSSRAADRAAVKSKMHDKAADDLVSLYASAGDGVVDSLAETELPSEMKAMSKAEQKAFIKDQSTKRGEVSKKIADIEKKRALYIKNERAKAPSKKEGFDDEVVDMVRDSGSKVGLDY